MLNGKKAVLNREVVIVVPTNASRGETWACIITVLLCLVCMTVWALTQAIDSPVQHLDGAFQTASGLFRIDVGQAPGRDFFPYLGMGPLYLVFVGFKLFGSDLAASVAAAHLIVLLALAGSVGFMIFWARAFWRADAGSLMFVFALGCVLVALALELHALLPWWAVDRLAPGNSLRPLRAAAPYLAAMALFAASRIGNRNVAFISMGATLAASALWSNDFAGPSVLLCIAGAIKLAVTERRFLRPAAIFGLSSLLISTIVLLLATRGGVMQFLQFNVDVATDQWWYFGPWTEVNRVFSPQDLFKEFQAREWLGLALLPVLAGWFVVTRDDRIYAVASVGLALFLGACVASLGGHLAGYFEAFGFWACMLVVAAGVSLLIKITDSIAGRAFVSVVLVACAALLAAKAGLRYSDRLESATADPARFYVDELGGYLPVAWKPYVQAARTVPAQATEVEEYFGLWSAIRHPAPLFQVDSVIHALGRQRELAATTMAQWPDLIVTSRPKHTEWQGWSLSANYWFYRPLFGHYVPMVHSPYTTVWMKDTQGTPQQAPERVECRVSRTGIRIDSAKTGLYEVSLVYEASPLKRSLVLVENGIIDKKALGGRLSLPPQGRQASFPVFVDLPGRGGFELATLPATVEAVQPVSCSVRALRGAAANHFVYAQAGLLAP